MILAATGHRPNKLGGYSPEAHWKLVRVAGEYLQAHRPTGVLSGMALGWDQAVACAAWHLGIPWVACVPFEGQESKWPEPSRTQYKVLIAKAFKVHVVSPGGYSPEKMQVRNMFMVDNANGILAMWDGTPGGTRNCLEYARSVGRPVLNLHSVWSAG
jgi:uncharacterized phage-like protein YoqJ